MDLIAKFFKFEARKTSFQTEFRAGVTVFLTMAYILFVNPMILKEAGIPPGACLAATAIASGISCIMMGLISNFPMALASGMGINSFIAFTLVIGKKLAWQTAMGLVFLDGVVVLILVIIGFREAVMNAIPSELKHSIAVGIGFLLAYIGFINGGIAEINKIVGIPAAGTLFKTGPLAAALGILIISTLVCLKIRGGILIGIILNTILAIALGVTKLPESFALFSMPDFSTIGALDISSALNISLLPMLISLIVVDFFDTLGTVTAIGYEAKLTDESGKIKGISRILGIDAIAAMLGGFCGASSVTSYIESAAGVSEGGRTGLTAVVTGFLFLISIFLAPLVGIVPKEATAPALIVIGFLMMENITKINFYDYEIAIPAFIIMIAMPFTYSIAHGIGLGFISYTVIKIVAGKSREVHPLMYATSIIFLISFAIS